MLGNLLLTAVLEWLEVQKHGLEDGVFQRFWKCNPPYSYCQLLITVVGITRYYLFLSEFSAKNPRFNHCWVRRWHVHTAISPHLCVQLDMFTSVALPPLSQLHSDFRDFSNGVSHVGKFTVDETAVLIALFLLLG